MTPTAISKVVEQCGKVVLGLLFASLNQLYYEDFCMTKSTQKIGNFLIGVGWIKSFRDFPK